MSDSLPPPPTPILRRVLLALAGLLIAAVAGGFAFFRPAWGPGGPSLIPRVPLKELLATVAATPLPSVILLLLCMASAVPLRALQIRITARAVDGTPKMAGLLRAAGVSAVGQSLLPMKLGEAARYLVLRQDALIPFPVSIAASAVDRSLDVGALFVCAVLIPLALGLPATRVPALRSTLPWMAAGLALVVAAILVLLRLHAPLTRALRGRFDRVARVVERFGQGARYASTPRRLALGLANACLIVLLYSLGIWVALRALNIQLPTGAPLIIVALIFVSSAVPGAPSGVGVFDWAASAALTMMGAPVKDALAFAVLMHAADVIGTTLAGGLALGLIRGRPLRWRDLTSELPAETNESTPERPASAA